METNNNVLIKVTDLKKHFNKGEIKALDGVSLDMYYCIQSMRRSGRTMTMTELANFARMPKQQMSKLVVS